MTKVFSSGLLGCLVLAFLAGPSLAAEPKPATPHVVIVGVNEFADKQITPRPNAERDAKALHDLFTNKDYLGVDADHVKLLLGKDATHDKILEAVHWLESNAKVDDLVIFAYLGQGGSLGERGDRRCYFASDSTLKDRDKTAVAATALGDAFNKLKANKVLVLLDVNFKGFTTTESIPEATLGFPPYKEFLGDDGTEDHAPVPGRVVFSAGDGLSPSLDLENGGVFTTVVVDALKGAADVDGKEADGVVIVDELTEHVRKQLPELCRTHGKTKEQKEQFPVVWGGASNHFVITKNPAVTAKVAEQLDKLQKLLDEKKITEKVAEEGRALLSRMPKLSAQRDLRKAFQLLVGEELSVEKFLKSYDSIYESTKLDPDDAKEFAASVMTGVRQIRNNYVKETNAGELVGWAIRGLYKRIEEKLPEDVIEKLAKVKDLNEKELLDLLVAARTKLGKREDLDKHKDIDIALQRMMSHLDPYTTYIDKESKEGSDNDIQGQFTGIGIQIRKDTARDMLQVVTPIRGSPAHKMGLLTGDIVTTIIRDEDSEGKKLDPPEVISTKGLSTTDAVKKIKGKAGTKVKLVVEREGEPKPLEFEVRRDKVEVETVMGHRRKENGDWNFYVDETNKIGYVRLTAFGRKTAESLEDAVKAMKKEGLKGLVLDLRFNPGGLLSSAIDVSDLFVEDGRIVTVRPRVGAEQPHDGRSEGSQLGFPMVCLINGQSASASEIVSACLQDHGRAKVVGERSYGKGSVQNIMDFQGGELKLTVATYWRPNDKNINKSSTKGGEDEDWGVRPDRGFKVDLTGKERDDLYEHQRNTEIIQRPDRYIDGLKKLDQYKDVQMEKAMEYLREQIKIAAQNSPKKDD